MTLSTEQNAEVRSAVQSLCLEHLTGNSQSNIRRNKCILSLLIPTSPAGSWSVNCSIDKFLLEIFLELSIHAFAHQTHHNVKGTNK